MTNAEFLIDMGHGELARKTHELLEVLRRDYLPGVCTTALCDAVRQLEPTPLDELHQFLKANRWAKLSDEASPRPGRHVVEINRRCDTSEIWVHTL